MGIVGSSVSEASLTLRTKSQAISPSAVSLKYKANIILQGQKKNNEHNQVEERPSTFKNTSIRLKVMNVGFWLLGMAVESADLTLLVKLLHSLAPLIAKAMFESSL